MSAAGGGTCVQAPFGKGGAASAADWVKSEANRDRHFSLFPGGNAPLRRLQPAAIRDRLHATKLLQARSDARALHAFVHAERKRGPTFLRLANALITLYARGSQERLLNAMLLATPKWATEVRVP